MQASDRAQVDLEDSRIFQSWECEFGFVWRSEAVPVAKKWNMTRLCERKEYKSVDFVVKQTHW